MDMTLLLPEILILCLAVLILALDWILGKAQKRFLGYAAVAGLAAVFLVMLVCAAKGVFPFAADLSMNLANGQTVFQGFVLDAFAVFFKGLFLLIALLVSVFSLAYFESGGEGEGEYYALLLLATLGCFLLVSASDLLMLFVAFELMSLPLYILSAYSKRSGKSSEAGLKYFLIGAVTSALLVYGISLVYASLGTTDLVHLTAASGITMKRIAQEPALLIGLFFMLCAFAFKISAAPFHMWAPDVYEGAPAPVAAFLALAPKVAVVGLLCRIFIANMSSIQPFWVLIFGILAALSMTVGNLGALHQQNLRRLLAYSGIAQMGYMMVGFAAAQPISSGLFPSQQFAYQAILLYLVAYVFSELAAFGSVVYLSSKGYDDIRSLRGLASKYPALAFIFLVALLSLAGVPPLIGFVGKFYLFTAAFSSKLYWLVVLGVLNSVVSLFYYLQVGKSMYFEKEGEAAPAFLPAPLLTQAALWVAFLGIVVIGIYPNVTVQYLSQNVLVPLAKISLGF